MPTYELTCKTCGHAFERFLMRLIRETDRVCPECGSTHVVTGVGGGYVRPAAPADSGCGSSGRFG